MVLAYGKALNTPHRISRRLPLRQAQGTGSASATPPQGGSDCNVKRAYAFTTTYLVAAEHSEAALGEAYLFPPLSSGGASIAAPCSVSTSRSSNRTCGFPASGSRTRIHAFAHGKLRIRPSIRVRPSVSYRTSLGNRDVPFPGIRCLLHSHQRSRSRVWASTLR